MALALAHHWAELGDGPVLFVSLEMKRKKILDRLVARVSGVSSQKLILGDVTPEEEASVREGLERIRQLPIVYLDDRYSTTATVRSMAARVAMQKGKLSAIVVDYIALLNDPGDQEVQRIARITGNLKSLAGEADCPVLALSQLNRQVEFRADKHPILSDLRDSGAVEQDADTVIALTDLDPMMDVEVLKQRQGNTSRIRVRFDGNTTSFHAPGPWSEPEAAPSAEEEPALTW
jgi:replicative DNA helicase